jgi:hypothetical protein
MTRHLIGILIVSTAMLAGCGPEDSPAARDAAAAQREAAASADRTAAEVKSAADKAAADTRAAVEQAAAEARSTAQKAAADARSAADQAAAEARSAADQAAANAVAAADSNAALASSLLTQMTEYIRDNKFDLAEKALAQLDGMKDSLPASIQQQIEAARSALAAKKTAAAFW